MCSGVSKMGEKGFCLSLDVSHALITPWKERAHKLLGLTRERGLLWRGASRRVGGGLMREGCIREEGVLERAF